MSAHTPGPWCWVVNPKNYEVDLSRGQYGSSVLRFERWGMGSATPMFNVNGVMKRAVDVSRPQHGREHHAEWWRIIDHPDARLIAAAPELLEALERTLGLAEKWADGVGRSHPDHDVIAEARAAIAKATGGEP